MRWCLYVFFFLQKVHKNKRNELEKLLHIFFDIVQKEHEYEFFKCEPIGFKLWFMLQSLHSALKNSLTKESMFYKIAHMNHN